MKLDKLTHWDVISAHTINLPPKAHYPMFRNLLEQANHNYRQLQEKQEGHDKFIAAIDEQYQGFKNLFDDAVESKMIGKQAMLSDGTNYFPFWGYTFGVGGNHDFVIDAFIGQGNAGCVPLPIFRTREIAIQLYTIKKGINSDSSVHSSETFILSPGYKKITHIARNESGELFSESLTPLQAKDMDLWKTLNKTWKLAAREITRYS